MNALDAWTHAVAEIPDSGLQCDRAASPAELSALAAALDLPGCEQLSARYTIEPLGADRYRLHGTLSARVTQACVVTLEPVTATLDEPFDEELWPESDIPAHMDAGEHEALAVTEPEPIRNGLIEVGRIVYETLAAAIDPYPRKPGAELVLPYEAEGEAARSGPFAALATLKRDS